MHAAVGEAGPPAPRWGSRDTGRRACVRKGSPSLGCVQHKAHSCASRAGREGWGLGACGPLSLKSHVASSSVRARAGNPSHSSCHHSARPQCHLSMFVWLLGCSQRIPVGAQGEQDLQLPRALPFSRWHEAAQVTSGCFESWCDLHGDCTPP